MWNDINPQTTTPLFAIAQTATAATLTANNTTAGITYKNNGINGLPTLSFFDSTAFRRLILSSLYSTTAPTATVHTNVIAAVPAVTNNASTIFVVFNDFSIGNEGIINNGGGDTTTATDGFGIFKYYSATGVKVLNETTFIFDSPTTNKIPQIICVTTSGFSTLSTITQYVNGKAGASLTSSLTVDALSPTEFWISRGATNAGVLSSFRGHISEVIMFDVVLKSSDRISVMSYLGKKYGLVVK